MEKKLEILELYFEMKMTTVEIAEECNVSQQYVSKVIRKDIRYKEEKTRRKEERKLERNNKNKEYMKKKRASNRISKEVMDIQHFQASMELSGRRKINNRAFRNWNPSIYKFHNKTKEYRVKEEMKDKVTYDVPQKIKWK